MEEEWETEPDFKEGKYLGYSYNIKRHPEMKHLCGYVVVPKSHMLYRDENVCERIINCHGGITYTGIDTGKWAIGFDCAHSGDKSPSLAHFLKNSPYDNPYDSGVYRNIEYVERECYDIIVQLKQLSGFKYYDMSGYSSNDVDDKIQWCMENCRGQWKFLEDFYNIIVFKNKQDFMFYRLRWGVGND
jgi:hypothetical protein